MGLEAAVTKPIANLSGSTNKYHASQAKLDESQYGDSIKAALAQNQAQMQANAGGGTDMAAFADALRAQAAGNGPSLAQRQLETATQQNQAQAAGALASAKGINPALAARMIAQTQAGMSQAAAGQAATTRMAEQLNTQDLLAKAMEAKRAQDIAQQQANTAAVGTLGGLQSGQNSLRVQSKLGTEQINAGVASQNAETNKQVFGGIMQGMGAAMQGAGSAGGGGGGGMGGMFGGGAGKYDGGEIEPLKLSGGGNIWAKILEQAGKGFSAMGKRLEEERSTPAADRFSGGPNAPPPQITTPSLASMSGYGQMVGEGPKVMENQPPSMLDTMRGYGQMVGAGPAEDRPIAVPAEGGDVQTTAPNLDTMRGYGQMVSAADGGQIDFRAGGPVPGRAKVAGDDPENDTVPAMVSPGEIVLPRTVAQADDAPEQAAEFVKAIQAKKKPPVGYGAVLQATRALERHLAEGGEVEAGLGSKLKKWWNSSTSDADEGKDVAEAALDKTNGLARQAKDAAKKRYSELDAAYAAAVGD